MDTDRLKQYAPWVGAGILVVFLLIVVVMMVIAPKTDAEHWDRLLTVYKDVQTLAFAAAAAFLGREVGRANLGAVEEKAKAATAEKQEAQARQAGAEQQAQAVQTQARMLAAAVRKLPDHPTAKGLTLAPDKPAPWHEAVELANRLFPEGEGTGVGNG